MTLFRRDEKLLFFPYWSIALIPFGLLPFLVAFAVLRREKKVTYYLSAAGKTVVLKRRLAIGGVMIFAIITMIVGAIVSPMIFLLTIISLGFAAYLYRKMFFPFQFCVVAGNAVIVYSLPKSFDGPQPTAAPSL